MNTKPLVFFSLFLLDLVWGGVVLGRLEVFLGFGGGVVFALVCFFFSGGFFFLVVVGFVFFFFVLGVFFFGGSFFVWLGFWDSGREFNRNQLPPGFEMTIRLPLN